jgi:nicotinate-nucleotide pyrophosphorylase (carboxylating)
MASPSTTATPDYSQVLPKGQIEATVKEWLDDDMPSFDIGGLVVGSDVKSARLLLKSSGVFCGKPFMEAVFHLLNCTIAWKEEAIEGTFFDISSSSEPLCLAIVTGPVNALLRGERTALNTLSRCSGVATASRRACAIASSCHWNGHVAGTRKTTPGFRIAEKYGLLVGGAATHRLDLSQMTMLKDNHIWSAGSISAAVALAKRAAGFSSKVEVECQSLQEAVEAATAGADVSLSGFCLDTPTIVSFLILTPHFFPPFHVCYRVDCHVG